MHLDPFDSFAILDHAWRPPRKLRKVKKKKVKDRSKIKAARKQRRTQRR